MAILKRVQHDHIITLKEVFETPKVNQQQHKHNLSDKPTVTIEIVAENVSGYGVLWRWRTERLAEEEKEVWRGTSENHHRSPRESHLISSSKRLVYLK